MPRASSRKAVEDNGDIKTSAKEDPKKGRKTATAAVVKKSAPRAAKKAATLKEESDNESEEEALVPTSRKQRKPVKAESETVVAKTKAVKPTKKTVKAVQEDKDSEEEEEDKVISVKKESAKNNVSSKGNSATEGSAKKAPVKRKAKNEEGESADEKKPTKKRKTKEEKEAEAMPLAGRTLVSTLKKSMYIGAHVSGAGGVQSSIQNSVHIGGNSFALFLKSQRKWASPPMAEEAREQFKAFCLEHNYDAAKHVLPHGSYLVNLAQKDADKATQAYTCFLDDLERCEALGIMLYNFHPGNTGKEPRPEAIGRIAAQLNKAHKATKSVITVLENMAGAGNVIGSTWEDLRDIIALVEDKSRVGVCIDTCHTFASGYDLRSPEEFKKTMDSFGAIVGMSYLKALHLNDSKAPIASHRDLHANIGTGFLGLRAFHNVMNFEPFQHLPMVLETPTDKKGADGKSVEDKSVWAAEIKLLEGLIGKDPESDDFKAESKRLQDIGADERKKIQDQVDKKKVPDKKQGTLDSMLKRAPAKGKQKIVEDEASDASSDEGACSH